jgi:hypothetical protein
VFFELIASLLLLCFSNLRVLAVTYASFLEALLLINALFGEPPGEALFCLFRVLIDYYLLSSYFYVDILAGLLLGDTIVAAALSFSIT